MHSTRAWTSRKKDARILENVRSMQPQTEHSSLVLPCGTVLSVLDMRHLSRILFTNFLPAALNRTGKFDTIGDSADGRGYPS